MVIARAVSVGVCLVPLVLGCSVLASAQETMAVVTTNAPIYLNPDTTRTPLRTAAVNTILRVLEDRGDWLQVEFQDPQYGRRVGFVQAKNVRIDRAEQRPMDLSVRPPVTGAARPPTENAPAEPQLLPRRRDSSRPNRARACVGQGSGRSIAGFTGSFGTGVQGISGDFGGAGGRFWSLGSVGYTNYSDADVDSIGWGGIFGGDVAPRDSVVHACPVGGVFYTHLNDSDVNEFDVTAGGSVGVVAFESREVTVIPTVSGSYTRAILLDEDFALNLGSIRAGVGLVFQDTITVLPAVVFPIHADGTDPSFAISVSFGFGR